LHAFRGDKELEFNGGHEVAGVVVDSAGSRWLKAGEAVGVHAVIGCGNCRWCLKGQYTYCDQRDIVSGAHAELLSVVDHACLKLPEGVPFEVGVLLSGDAIGVPYHVNRRLKTRGGDVVCVVGSGPVGLGNILLQSFFGAEVIAVDINDYRLSLAKELGATHTVNSSKEDPVSVVSDISRGMMANSCIEAVGRKETVQLALRCAGKGGKVMCCGEQGEVPVNISKDLIRRDIDLMGSWYYHYSEYPYILDLYHRGLRVDKLITHRFPLKEAQEAFLRFSRGETGKSMLVGSA
jgi:propanol-preferring alcohol dehydrogenase